VDPAIPVLSFGARLSTVIASKAKQSMARQIEE
jgi:hypothetical protein